MQVQLKIDGMTCGGCVKSVEKILSAVSGVKSADVSLEKQSAVVDFDEKQNTVADLIAAIEEGGFEASV